MTKNAKSVIVGVTGGIAAYKACEIISLLKKQGLDVTVLLTKEAEEFVTPLTFQTISGNKVYRDLFALPDAWSPVHTSLADRADLIVIAPATANLIGKLASGICDDMLTCTIFASKAPVLIAPAMNEKMYEHKIVRANIEKLKAVGYKFVGPVKGRLACGHEAIGHIAEPRDIVKEIDKTLK
jgi:phosphopantothenoylcysteine decarboxylase/phosphopantothenate--cysteine ligase